MLSSPEREVNGTPSAGYRVCRLSSRPNRPAAPLRRSSILPKTKPWRDKFASYTKKTGHPKLGVLFHSGAGNEARARFPASREWLTAIRRPPASPLIQSRLRRGAEAASSLSDEKTGHPKLGVLFHSGAGNEARTRYLHLGKVALYQMSYARGTRGYSTRETPACQDSSARFSEFSSAAAAASPPITNSISPTGPCAG